MASVVLSLRDIKKTYTQSGNQLSILNGISFDLSANDTVALTGASGSGKTTLLQIMGLIDSPTEGAVSIDGNVVKADLRDQYRRTHIGFVYQHHHLLPELTALENVAMPQLIAGQARNEANERARSLLHEMGLDHRAAHLPAQLSGGEQQRVAIARALANSPKILLADEPTGNLDDRTAQHVFETLMLAAQQKNIAAVVATHNMELVRYMSRHVELRLGALDERH
ncbi:MAG: ABC transporter ATP-binding protein [Holosporales bacterium]|jgi:lipoprotein-releasing system ATP-binding protein|nr:ABC transporter ATP-binding protein [Holosporales bacterium]